MSTFREPAAYRISFLGGGELKLGEEGLPGKEVYPSAKKDGAAREGLSQASGK